MRNIQNTELVGLSKGLSVRHMNNSPRPYIYRIYKGSLKGLLIYKTLQSTTLSLVVVWATVNITGLIPELIRFIEPTRWLAPAQINALSMQVIGLG